MTSFRVQLRKGGATIQNDDGTSTTLSPSNHVGTARHHSVLTVDRTAPSEIHVEMPYLGEWRMEHLCALRSEDGKVTLITNVGQAMQVTYRPNRGVYQVGTDDWPLYLVADPP